MSKKQVVYRLKCSNCGLVSDPISDEIVEQAMDTQKYPDAVNQEFRCSKGCGKRGTLMGRNNRNFQIVEEAK